MKQNEDKSITKDFRVDQYDRVYDETGVFYCNWDQLTDTEQETVKLNPMSAR